MKSIFICHKYNKRSPHDLTPYENRQIIIKICKIIRESNPDVIPIAPQIYLHQFVESEEEAQKICLEMVKMVDEVWVYIRCLDIQLTNNMRNEIKEAHRYNKKVELFVYKIFSEGKNRETISII